MDSTDSVDERLAQILDRTGHFRILRRVPAPAVATTTLAERSAAGLATAIVLDTETTGLGSDDEIIELGMAAVTFDPAFARVDHVASTFSALRAPSRPIPPDVAGHRTLPQSLVAVGCGLGTAVQRDGLRIARERAVVGPVHRDIAVLPLADGIPTPIGVDRRLTSVRADVRPR